MTRSKAGAVAGFALALILIAYGSGGGGGSESNGSGDSEGSSGSSGNARGSASSETVEYKLAVVDTGRPPDDSTVARYASALDSAEAVCPEARIEIADLAVASVQTLDERSPGHGENGLSMVRAIASSADTDVPGGGCTELAAALVILMVSDS